MVSLGQQLTSSEGKFGQNEANGSKPDNFSVSEHKSLFVCMNLFIYFLLTTFIECSWALDADIPETTLRSAQHCYLNNYLGDSCLVVFHLFKKSINYLFFTCQKAGV